MTWVLDASPANRAQTCAICASAVLAATVWAINVRCTSKTRNRMCRPRAPHPNDELGPFLWQLADPHPASELHDVHRFDFILPSRVRAQILSERRLPSSSRGDSKCRASERPPSGSHLVSSQPDEWLGRGVGCHWGVSLEVVLVLDLHQPRLDTLHDGQPTGTSLFGLTFVSLS